LPQARPRRYTPPPCPKSHARGHSPSTLDSESDCSPTRTHHPQIQNPPPCRPSGAGTRRLPRSRAVPCSQCPQARPRRGEEDKKVEGCRGRGERLVQVPRAGYLAADDFGVVGVCTGLSGLRRSGGWRRHASTVIVALPSTFWSSLIKSATAPSTRPL
jgi:hypothetical protein